jgi:hypothetical protein
VLVLLLALAHGSAAFRSNYNPLDRIECNLIAGAVIELGRTQDHGAT